jgi:uncharacterized protein YneR
VDIKIEAEALNWYKNELELKNGDHVRFFVRYGGCSTVQQGFSLGVAKDNPQQIGVSTEMDGIIFYIEEQDVWFFDDHDLVVEYSSSLEEPEFQYQ